MSEWIEWKPGSGRPVPAETEVEVEFGTGYRMCPVRAHAFTWGPESDIVAYRVVGDQPIPMPEVMGPFRASLEKALTTPAPRNMCASCGQEMLTGFGPAPLLCNECRSTNEPPPLDAFTYMLDRGKVQIVVEEGATREALAAARRFLDMMLAVEHSAQDRAG